MGSEVYKKFRSLMDNHIIISFKGEITSDIITMILQIMESKLESSKEKSSVKKKIFNILVECMQNLYHHAEAEIKESDDESKRPAMLELYFDEDFYNIATGNYIKNDAIKPLEERIERVNSLDKKELRKYYREILDNNQISDKGGADLGMIDMARKSGEKLEYNFTKVNEEISFFDLLVKIKRKKRKDK